MSSPLPAEPSNGCPPRNADEFNHRGHRAHRWALASSFFLHPSYFLKMTLGRTSSGAVKIKTDGGTTRAVECACCGSLGCQITQAQFNAIRYGFTTNFSGTQGIGTRVQVNQVYEYSFQHTTEDREEIFGALENQTGDYYSVSTTGPFTCIVDGPPGSGITYPVEFYNQNFESTRLYWFYTAYIPNDTAIAPTYFLTVSTGLIYDRTETECPNDGNPPTSVTKEYKSSLDLCGDPLYKLALEGADWPPQP